MPTATSLLHQQASAKEDNPKHIPKRPINVKVVEWIFLVWGGGLAAYALFGSVAWVMLIAESFRPSAETGLGNVLFLFSVVLLCGAAAWLHFAIGLGLRRSRVWAQRSGLVTAIVNTALLWLVAIIACFTGEADIIATVSAFCGILVVPMKTSIYLLTRKPSVDWFTEQGTARN